MAAIFIYIFLTENLCILFQISLKFFSKSPVNIKVVSIQVMALCQTGGKPLPEPMMTEALIPLITNWPQWVEV